jgi:hypothetical protein
VVKVNIIPPLLDHGGPDQVDEHKRQIKKKGVRTHGPFIQEIKENFYDAQYYYILLSEKDSVCKNCTAEIYTILLKR